MLDGRRLLEDRHLVDGREVMAVEDLTGMHSLGFYFPGGGDPDQRPPQTRTILNSLSSVGEEK